MERYIIELIDILDLLNSKWRGVAVCYDHESIKHNLEFIGQSIQSYIALSPFFDKKDGECFATLSGLAKAITAPGDLCSKLQKNGVQVYCYSTGYECSFKEKFENEIMYKEVCKLFERINDNEANIKVASPADPHNMSSIIAKQLNSFTLSNEEYEDATREQHSCDHSHIEQQEIEPIDGQRPITDNAVWWITKAMAANKGVKIADTKTLGGLNIILNKTGKKLYERRSLNCTRTEIKSLKEFLQQLLDSVPEPKN